MPATSAARAGARSTETETGSSLRRSLLRALAVPILVALLAGGVFGYQAAEKVVSAAYDQSLANLASGIANRARVENGKITIGLTAEAEELLRTDTVDHIYFRVRDESGRIVAGHADLPPPEGLSGVPPPPFEARDQRPNTVEPIFSFFDGDFRGEAIRGVRFHPVVDQHGVYVTVAETLGKRRAAIGDLLFGFGLAVLLVLAAVAAVANYGITSGLASLYDLEAQLAERSGQDLAPIDLRQVPLEIREVVRALNALLARLHEANAAQRKFLQDAAHQLRTPLAGLQVQIELLNGEQTDQAVSKQLRKSVKRVTRLANQLLALARAEAGQRLMANASSVDLAKLIDEMLEEWLRIADEKKIDFGIQRGVSTIIGDPTLLRELLANLVDNALKYTPTGGLVTLRCERVGDLVEIDVSDNGPGIPEDERERVFERFHRLPDAMAAGSGLGLPIAREIVGGHHGSIVISSCADGKGSCVQVRLPAKPPPGSMQTLSTARDTANDASRDHFPQSLQLSRLPAKLDS
ncbi:sensor histidine kinase [Candidatus Accumulibacter sp. ACC003]|uniref:sensor histidine kinase n=1 Tax=Candidatus Accumulibacter sp. ACC003 TaxID=2823334 RepID=UPI0025BFE76C|nr:sensor histidine kinase [Candidatus Accumulibacter sp. ACC003]